MQYRFLLALLLLIQGCTLQPTKLEPIKSVGVPKVWQAQGRMSVVNDTLRQSYQFDVSFDYDDYQIKLSAPLGLAVIEIVSNNQTISVNNQAINTSLTQWLQTELGWSFSLEALAEIIFQPQTAALDDWQVDIIKYQTIDSFRYPKIVRLKHQKQAIKIKLLINKVNQLK